MRILFLSNFYPPYEIGGLEQLCWDRVRALRERGHTTLVLTSTHGVDKSVVEVGGIHRELALEMELKPLLHGVHFFLGRRRRERQNLTCLKRVVRQFGPDLIYIWGMWNLPRSIPWLAEQLRPGKVVYQLADYWPTLPTQHEFYWRAPGRRWFTEVLKKPLAKVALHLLSQEQTISSLRFDHAICVSIAVRDNLLRDGVPVANARIIYNGVEVERFKPAEMRIGKDSDAQPLALLYLGRLSPEKGVETAIEALAQLVYGHHTCNVSLALIGAGAPEYETILRNLATRLGVGEHVTFWGRVPREEVPDLMRQFDVLLVPSVWQEPFGRVVLEGMASGLVVAAAEVGGIKEVLAPEENGLLFLPGDVPGLARQIRRLADDPELRRQLAKAGRETVVRDFSLDKMNDQVEAYLQEVVAGSG
jgi:glycosyltransferase involved in cell wall biosynthesis